MSRRNAATTGPARDMAMLRAIATTGAATDYKARTDYGWFVVFKRVKDGGLIRPNIDYGFGWVLTDAGRAALESAR